MAKRMTLAVLRKHDLDKGDCIVRELEMDADHLITTPGYVQQFWKDVEVYGVDEAILYVENGNYGDAKALRAAWSKIAKRFIKAHPA